jgi:hypothetical protein
VSASSYLGSWSAPMLTSLATLGRRRQTFFIAGLACKVVDVRFCSGTSREVGSILAAERP